MSNPDEIVGHKTHTDGTHSPLRRAEADALWAECERLEAKRKADMPTEQDALNQLGECYQRLKELGWNDAQYCPKDGSMFLGIEVGSTGIHECFYSGVWPNGYWWHPSHGDLWPIKPILFKLKEQPSPINP